VQPAKMLFAVSNDDDAIASELLQETSVVFHYKLFMAQSFYGNHFIDYLPSIQSAVLAASVMLQTYRLQLSSSMLIIYFRTGRSSTSVPNQFKLKHFIHIPLLQISHRRGWSSSPGSKNKSD